VYVHIALYGIVSQSGGTAAVYVAMLCLRHINLIHITLCGNSCRKQRLYTKPRTRVDIPRRTVPAGTLSRYLSSPPSQRIVLVNQVKGAKMKALS